MKTTDKAVIQLKKVYSCLYTFVVVRHVHLTVLEEFSVAAFLGTFLRLVSRRGITQETISDNARNFKGGKGN